MLNSSTSQKPMALRNCDFESEEEGAGIVMASPFARCAASGHDTGLLDPHECSVNGAPEFAG
jgi:hypothetical protein